MTSRAPLLTDTLAGVSLMLEEPLESSIPDESITSLSGVETAGGLTSSVSPPPPGRC